MAFCQHFKEQFENIDILINNAGNQRESREGWGVHLFIPVGPASPSKALINQSLGNVDSQFALVNPNN